MIELNIGLDIEGHDNEGPAITERARGVRALVRHINPQASIYQTGSSYQRDGEAVHEHVLVCQLSHIPTAKQLSAMGAALGSLFGQDCYAAYWPDTGDGLLIGPRAEQWGEFDKQFFIRYLGG